LEVRRSAIWGGATLGLVVGLILGFFVGSYWTTVLYAVLIGAGCGVAANALALVGGRRDVKRRKDVSRAASSSLLGHSEEFLREHNPAYVETNPTAESESHEVVRIVEDGEYWRAGYDSLEAFYAAHEDRHPEIRHYAARARHKHLYDAEEVLRANSPADFETTPDAAIDSVGAAYEIVEDEYWRAGYDSLEAFYAAHEARHPDIRVYADVYREVGAQLVLADPSVARGRIIAQAIADRR
jgi:hypothetical protein